VAFAPQGDMLATTGFDNTVRVWNLDGSARGTPIQAHYNIVYSVSFSADGRYLASTGGDDRVRLWTADGARVAAFPQRAAEPVAAVALPASEPILVTAIGEARLWNFDGTVSGKPFAGQEGAVRSLAFAPTGDTVASGGVSGAVQLWNRDASLRKTLCRGKSSAVNALAFAPDGKTLASGGDALTLWSQVGLNWQQPFGAPDTINEIAYSPHGNLLATGSLLGRLQVWRPDGSTRAGPVKLAKENIRALAFAPNGEFVASAGGYEAVVRLWNLDGTPRGKPLEGHRDAVVALAFAPVGLVLASGSTDGTVRLWHLQSDDVEVMDIGVPVNQLGFWRDVLWVRANTDTIFFYSHARQLVATTMLRRDALLSFTPDGWFSGTGQPQRFVRAFGESGEALAEKDVIVRLSPAHVLAALNGKES
jgi:WD40 repeat protein